jgi:cytochrome c biogenesis protein CcdA
LLMLGLGTLLSSFGGALESPLAYAVQGVVGAAMLIYSFLAPNKTKADGAPTPSPRALGGTFLLGITVTVLEFPTAFPYLGAVGILTGAALSPAQWFPILLVYNLIFILPPLLLLLAHMLLGERLETRFISWQPRLQREAKETMLWIVGIVGFVLLAGTLEHFEFFGLLG